MKHLLIIFFVLMCLAQWFVPGKMIYDSEVTIREGKLYKFRTRPIDPTDPFRGKYVTLSFREEAVHVDPDDRWAAGDEIFVEFATDEEGYAIPSAAYREAPSSESYLQTRVSYIVEQEDAPEVFYHIPFDRLYLEESKASEAERVYWESQPDTTQVTYAQVRIGKGQAVLQNVYINDKTLVDIVNEINTKSR